MNSSQPFPKNNPFGTTAVTAQPALLTPQTLVTHLSPLGLGRQTSQTPTLAPAALPFRRSA